MKSKYDFSRELRFSGIPENKAEKIKPNRVEIRGEIFEHEEEQLGSAMKILGVGVKEISSFRRFGAYNPDKQRPRPLLVKFTQEYFVEKILARAAAFQTYEPKNNERTYSIFVWESLNLE